MSRLACAGWLVPLLFGMLFGTVLQAADISLERYDRVEIAPTKTSIYIGTVSMTVPPLTRQNGAFSTTYVAKVFPYFFYNEKGSFAIEMSDTMLRQLAGGQVVEFHGDGANTDGERRRIEGRAVPADAKSGKIKVRVFVSTKIQLIFNTTYRFPKA